MTTRPVSAAVDPGGRPPATTGAVLAALADPTRRRLVELLAERGGATATSLARELPVTRQAVVQHLAVLKQAGVVVSQRAGRDVRFELEPGSLTGAARWIDSLTALWDQRLAALKEASSETSGTDDASPVGC